MKKSCLFILLFIAIISLSACVRDEPVDDTKSLPILKVIYGNEIIKAELGTSSWSTINKDGSKSIQESYTADPAELVKETDFLKVSTDSLLELDFTVDPKNIRVNIWKENEQLEQDSTDMKITVPDVDIQ